MRSLFSELRRHGILIAIMAVGVFLRFNDLGLVEHNVDRAYPIYQALRTLDEGFLPLTAQGTSVLFDNPPLMGYILVLPVAIWRSPYAAYIFVTALNSLAPYLVYRLGIRLMDRRRALVAAALMAFNPWVIEYSRYTWVQGLLPFLTTLTAWLLFPVMAGKATHPIRRTALGLIALAVMCHTYLLAFATLAPTIVLMAIFRRRVPIKGVLIGTVAFLALFIPYAVGLASQFEHTSARLASFAGSGPHLSAEAWWHAVRLVTGSDYELARGTGAPINDVELRHVLTQAAHYALLAALMGGIVASVIAVARGGNGNPQPDGRGGSPVSREFALMALIWFGMPVLMMSYVGWPVHPFYQLIGIPGGYLLTAIGVGLLTDRADIHGALSLAEAALVIAGIGLAVLGGVNSVRYAQETAALPGAHGLGALPLDVGIEMGRVVAELQPPDAPPEVYIDLDSCTISSLSGMVLESYRDARYPALSVVPAWPGALTVLFAEDDDPPAPLFAEYLADYEIELADGTSIRFYRYPWGSRDPAVRPSSEVGWPTDLGISLWGVDLPGDWEPGEPFVLLTWWLVGDELPPDVGEWLAGPFVHVFDATGERIAIGDGEEVPGYRWRPGDLFIQRITIGLPDGIEMPLEIAIGLYDPIRNRNAMFTPPDGEPRLSYTCSYPPD